MDNAKSKNIAKIMPRRWKILLVPENHIYGTKEQLLSVFLWLRALLKGGMKMAKECDQFSELFFAYFWRWHPVFPVIYSERLIEQHICRMPTTGTMWWLFEADVKPCTFNNKKTSISEWSQVNKVVENVWKKKSF